MSSASLSEPQRFPKKPEKDCLAVSLLDLTYSKQNTCLFISLKFFKFQGFPFPVFYVCLRSNVCMQWFMLLCLLRLQNSACIMIASRISVFAYVSEWLCICCLSLLFLPNKKVVHIFCFPYIRKAGADGGRERLLAVQAGHCLSSPSSTFPRPMYFEVNFT